MKPLKLMIEGLNSFGQMEIIDFDTLMQPGLFGIFGPTGSGKSSIIDGMTLALFGDVARGSKNFINVNVQKCQVSLEFQTGTDTLKSYKVSRSYKRDKISQNARADKARLELLVEGKEPEILADQTRSVDEQCSGILGLSRDDFTRTVILPQGKFSEFLQMGGKDRTDMLERIFRLEKFGIELDWRVKEYKRNTEQEMKVLEGQCQLYQEINPTLLQEKQEEYQKQEKEVIQIAESIKEIQEFIQIWSRVRELQKKFQNNEIRIAELEQQKMQIEKDRQELSNVRIANELYELHTASEDARAQYQISYERKKNELHLKIQADENFYRAQEDREKSEQKFRQESPKLEKELFQIDAALGKIEEIKQLEEKIHSYTIKIKQNTDLEKNLTEENDRIESQKSELKKKIDEYVKKKTGYFHAQEEKELVQKGYEAERELIRIEKECVHTNEQHKDRMLSRKTFHEQIIGLKERHTEKKKDLISTEFELRQLEEKLMYFADLTELALRVERVKSVKKIEQELKEEQKLVQTQMIYAKKEFIDLQEQEHHVCTEREKARSQMEESQRKVFAHKLAIGLTEGQPCPVCGNPHHSLLPDLSEDEQKLEHKQSKAVSQYEEIESQLEGIRVQLSTVNGRIQSIQINQQEIQKKQDKLDNNLLLENVVQLEENLAASKIRRNELEDKKKEYLCQREEKKEEIAKIESLLSAKEASMVEMNLQIVQLESVCADLQKQKSIQNEILQSCLNKKEEVSFSKAWEQIGADTKLYEQVDRVLQQADQERINLDDQLNKIGEDIAHLKQQLVRLEETGVSAKESIEKLKEELQDSIGSFDNLKERKVKTQILLKQLEQEFTKAKQNQQSAEVKRQEETDRYHELDVKAEKDASTFQSKLDHLKKRMKENFVTDTDWILQNYKDTEYAIQLEEKIKKYQDESLLVQTTRSELQAELAGRNISEEEWQKKTQGFEELQVAHKVKLTQSSVLKAEIVRLKKDLEDLEIIVKKLEVQKHQEALILELDKVLRGKAFVRYAAMYYLRSVTKDANKRLREMTSGNYELELSESGEFVICDYKNGGKIRSSATLSGGETFVVSLALALSLSKQIQLKGTTSIDLFFLDEGFGTLDERFIDIVMDSLYRLRERGLYVGLITHVEAIKERVGARILVTPSEAGGRGSRTTIEFH